VYDASYLELSRHHMIPLATNDADLVRAAGLVGVAVL
jgi:predicted nucleic acid-binding protein